MRKGFRERCGRGRRWKTAPGGTPCMKDQERQRCGAALTAVACACRLSATGAGPQLAAGWRAASGAAAMAVVHMTVAVHTYIL